MIHAATVMFPPFKSFTEDRESLLASTKMEVKISYALSHSKLAIHFLVATMKSWCIFN